MVWLRRKPQVNPWHHVAFSVPTPLLAGCLSNSDGSWPFFCLSSNNMAFKMLLTPHNSLRVPFTWVSEAVRETLTCLTGWQRTHRAAEQMSMLTLTGELMLWSTYCLAKPHTCTFSYSPVFYRLLTVEHTWIQNSKCDLDKKWRALSSQWNIFALHFKWRFV